MTDERGKSGVRSQLALAAACAALPDPLARRGVADHGYQAADTTFIYSRKAGLLHLWEGHHQCQMPR